MKTYMVYFEIFGKKMKTEINASSVSDAKQKILDKVQFHKVHIEEVANVDFLKNIFKIK